MADHGGECPFCKEKINVAAIRCKHCAADLLGREFFWYDWAVKHPVRKTKVGKGPQGRELSAPPGPDRVRKHFHQGREAIEREFARAPEDIRRRIRWLPLGVEVELAE